MRSGAVALKFSRIAATTFVALIIPVSLLGYALSGALGEADDARGPILLVWPASAVLTLVVIWRLSQRLSTWALAIGVVFAPLWSVALFGLASRDHLVPFWAELAVVVAWPLWGFLTFQILSMFFRRRSTGVVS